MWRKVKSGGQVPHLSRWFDFCAGQPQLLLALDDAATASGIKKREHAPGGLDQKKIESECLSPSPSLSPPNAIPPSAYLRIVSCLPSSVVSSWLHLHVACTLMHNCMFMIRHCSGHHSRGMSF